MKNKKIDVLMVFASVKPCKVSIIGTNKNLKYLVNPNLSFATEIEAVMLDTRYPFPIKARSTLLIKRKVLFLIRAIAVVK